MRNKLPKHVPLARSAIARLARLLLTACLVLLGSLSLTALSTPLQAAWAQDGGGGSDGSSGGSDAGATDGGATGPTDGTVTDPDVCTAFCGGDHDSASTDTSADADADADADTSSTTTGAFGRESMMSYAFDGAGYSYNVSYSFDRVDTTLATAVPRGAFDVSSQNTGWSNVQDRTSDMLVASVAPTYYDGGPVTGWGSVGGPNQEHKQDVAGQPPDQRELVALGPGPSLRPQDLAVLGAGAGGAVIMGGSTPQTNSGPSLTDQVQEKFGSVVDALVDFFQNGLTKKADEQGAGEDNRFPDRSLPRDEHGNPAPDPDAEGPYTQLGRKNGRNGQYDQAREFDADGKPVRDIDFTDHGRPDSHPNPHQHDYLPNPTGGTPRRGPSVPLSGG